MELINKRESEYEEYPIILELEIDVQQYPLYKVNEEIYALNKTFYFNLNNINVLFFNYDEMKKVVQKSKLVIEAKTITKYSSCFKTLHTISDLVQIKKPANLTLPHYDISLEILRDQLLNNIKGLFYAYCYKKHFSSYYSAAENVELLRNIANGLNDILNMSKDLTEDAEVINDILLLAKKQIKIHYTNNKDKWYSFFNSIDIFKFKYNIGLKFREGLLNDSFEFELYERIVNYLINSPKPKVGPLEKHESDMLIENVVQIIMLLEGDNSRYSRDIDLIYSRFSLRGYEVDIKDIKSTVLQNFFAFLLKFNNLEELERFIDVKDIQNEYIAYSFIGAFVGFSGLDREVTDSLFKYRNEDLFFRIDNYFDEIRNCIWNAPKLVEKPYEKHVQISLFEQSTTKQDSSKSSVSKHKSEINRNDYLTDIYNELQRIKQTKLIEEFLEVAGITLEDGTKVTFKKDGRNVRIDFNNHLPLKNIRVTLLHKHSITKEELLDFKQELKLLDIRSTFTRGNYPSVKFNNSDDKNGVKLSLEEEKLLLRWLKLIN
ncbi:hypothetical protein [Bacillus sp. FJAT-27445]|uniref:hypothetical protein n=1 Tax=Bacillus sp. FJAT-27445 TaxID=1679166 RepID=UPI0012E3DD1D|nr:hypothetical protein [Bacillus sp. FJAT-27445]